MGATSRFAWGDSLVTRIALAQSGNGLPFDRMASHIIRALRPARGERVILRHDSTLMMGLLAEAERQFQTLLDRKQAIFGPDHLDVSDALSNLASAGVTGGALLTGLAMVAVMNVVNFTDGVDGLAAGVCTISGVTFAVIALSLERQDAGELAALTAGAAFVFLWHNFHPASVFMGDAGSNLLGLMLACIAVQGVLKTAAVVALVFPLVVLAVPILDTSFVVLKRLKYRRPPWSAVTRCPPTRAPGSSSSWPPMHITSPSTRAVGPRWTSPPVAATFPFTCPSTRMSPCRANTSPSITWSVSMWMSEPIRTTSP